MDVSAAAFRAVVRSMATCATTAAVFVRAHDIIVRDVVQNALNVTGERLASDAALGADDGLRHREASCENNEKQLRKEAFSRETS